MSEEITNGSPQPAEKKDALIGVVAVAFATTDILTLLLAMFLPALGKRWQDLADAFSRLVFDFGFVITLAALVLALIAVARGGRDRKLGLLALALVAAGIAVMFF